MEFFTSKNNTDFAQHFMRLSEVDFSVCKAFVLRRFEAFCYFHHIVEFDKVEHLIGLDEQLEILRTNTASFLAGKNALNVLAWGARGCGKSSCIKRILGEFLGLYEDKSLAKSREDSCNLLRVLELDSKDILLLPLLFDVLRNQPYKFVIFCDDFSFRAGQSEYKSIKSVLEGSLEARAGNILLYATSNIRKIIENAGADNTPEHSIVQEELSFSDRFGLQIGFYDFGTREYLACIEEFLAQVELKCIGKGELDLQCENLNDISKNIRQKALNYATKMGGKNARIAKDFANLIANGIEKI